MEENHRGEDHLREAEERGRQKVVTLRSGLHDIFSKYDINLNAGLSSEDLVRSVAQLLGKSNGTNYREQLHIGWREEYRQLVQSIGAMTHQEFDSGTPPQEVLSFVEQQLNGEEWRGLPESA